MLVNADFTKPAIVTPDQYRWQPSPQPGVERMMLDRLGGENGRATSIVRYAPQSHFPYHAHPGGEEMLVLSGTFSESTQQDTHHYSTGWYLRSPPGSSHRPSSVEGTTIFVKLFQMRATDTQKVRLDTNDPKNWTNRQGRDCCPLYDREGETVSLERLYTGERLSTGHVLGMEILVLNGELHSPGQSYACGTWMRLPAGESPQLYAGPEGVTLYLKTGHLGNSGKQNNNFYKQER